MILNKYCWFLISAPGSQSTPASHWNLGYARVRSPWSCARNSGSRPLNLPYLFAVLKTSPFVLSIIIVVSHSSSPIDIALLPVCSSPGYLRGRLSPFSFLSLFSSKPYPAAIDGAQSWRSWLLSSKDSASAARPSQSGFSLGWDCCRLSPSQ